MKNSSKNPLLNSWLLILCEASVLDVATLKEAIRNAPLSLSEVQAYVRFDSAKYTRNLIYQCERFQVLCLGWLPGQGSPVHSHGTSVCAVRILQGVATERLYQSTVNCEVMETRNWFPGDVTASNGSLVHSITNENDQPLVTLHVYSPPLVRM